MYVANLYKKKKTIKKKIFKKKFIQKTKSKILNENYSTQTSQWKKDNKISAMKDIYFSNPYYLNGFLS